MQNKKLLLLILSIIYSLTLAACGFQMYSKEILPPQLSNIYIQSSEPYDTFTANVKHSLRSAGINLVTAAKESPVTLNISGISFTHDNPNITSSSQATIYNFTYTVTFNLLDKTGKTIVERQSISATRTLTLNPNEVLEASSEVSVMKNEMERELVMQIFNRLSSNNVAKALSTVKT